VRRVLVAAVAAGALALTSQAGSRIDEDPPWAPTVRAETAIFYYPWFGTPARDGYYRHWQQGGNVPPARLASNYYPARGPYSSSDERVLSAQMQEIAGAGVTTVIVSWWGRGSQEDRRLPKVLRAARGAGLAVAAHLEPYAGRTAAGTGVDIEYLRGLGFRDFYVWASSSLPAEEWRSVNETLTGVRVFANTNLAGLAAAGGFDGLYTYDVLLFDGSLFRRLCSQARRLQLLCAPSVGPGYDARRATGDTRLKARRNGATYDAMWRGAIGAGAEIVTVTSYNEWHEGTQIEPARAARTGYESYDGAWGLYGRAAERAYLERTLHWTGRFAAARR
jgi:hypothetical protein